MLSQVKRMDAGPMFKCEFLKMELLERVCIKRQHRAIEDRLNCLRLSRSGRDGISFESCFKCKQGAGIYREIIKKIMA